MSRPRRHVTKGLIDMLESVITPRLERGTTPGALIGDGRAPKPADGEPVARKPYAYVIGIPGGEVAGDAQDMISWEYEVMSVGTTRAQCELMADYVREAILLLAPGGGYENAIDAEPDTIAGRLLSSPGGPTPEGKLWHFPEIYRLTATPT